jgi:ALG6, ALG8 glycosyltransferase family
VHVACRWFGSLQVSARVAAIVTLLSMLPCLVSLWKHPARDRLVRACAYAALCGFMFGFHVHEKASLTFVLLMGLEAFRDSKSSRCAVPFTLQLVIHQTISIQQRLYT